MPWFDYLLFIDFYSTQAAILVGRTVWKKMSFNDTRMILNDDIYYSSFIYLCACVRVLFIFLFGHFIGFDIISVRIGVNNLTEKELIILLFMVCILWFFFCFFFLLFLLLFSIIIVSKALSSYYCKIFLL